jgi:subtilisin family serine protease
LADIITFRATVIAGMDFVVTDAATRNCPNGTVVNMSLGSGRADVLNAAAKSLVDSRVFVAVAAGNFNQDANDFSPASEPTVCTVGSMDINDQMWSFSNYGSAVDVWAPGSNILSTWIGGPDASVSLLLTVPLSCSCVVFREI